MDRLLSEIKAAFDKEMEARITDMASGNYNSIERYREAVGYLDGLRWARAAAIESYKRITGFKQHEDN